MENPHAFVCDLEVNHPFTHLSEFKAMLNQRADVDMYWETDVKDGHVPKLQDKLAPAKLILVKSDAVLGDQNQVLQLQDAVIHGRKNLMVLLKYTADRELERINGLLHRFNIQYSDLKVYDARHSVMGYERVIRLAKEDDCFHHDSLFEGVDTLVVSEPYALFANDPSEPLLTAQDSASTVEASSDLRFPLEGRNIQLGASYSQYGKILVLDESVFSDPVTNVSGYRHPGIEQSRRFVENVLDWMLPDRTA
jgi:hypothetical protein